MNDEPHRIEDNEIAGEQTESVVTVYNDKDLTVIIKVGFDDNLKEFQLWDYLYDVETERYSMETSCDYKNRIQYYEVSAEYAAIKKLIIWLTENDFIFKLDRKH